PTVATVGAVATLATAASVINVALKPVGEGTVTISADAPPGYTGQQSLSFTMKVSKPPLPMNVPFANVTIGRNLQAATTVYQSSSGSLNVTITSSDPSKVLLSTDPKAAGQASISTTINPYVQWPIYIQGLADSGTASLVMSAPGYNTQSFTVTLAPAA